MTICQQEREIDAESDWREMEDRLIAAVPDGLRSVVRSLLDDPHRGGRGLRALLVLLVGQRRSLPGSLPDELVRVYLTDDEAEPLHDCAKCGLPIPVRVGRRAGHEPTCERVYFPKCPHCGGPTGRFAYWSAGSSAEVN